jgi:hypothetical protein
MVAPTARLKCIVHDAKTRSAYEEELLKVASLNNLPGSSGRETAWPILAMLAGGVMLSRAVCWTTPLPKKSSLPASENLHQPATARAATLTAGFDAFPPATDAANDARGIAICVGGDALRLQASIRRGPGPKAPERLD